MPELKFESFNNFNNWSFFNNMNNSPNGSIMVGTLTQIGIEY